MRELSIFVDESGDADFSSKYYVLTLVFHDQRDEISQNVSAYELSLRDRGLPNIRFHANPLMRAQGPYANLSEGQRALVFGGFYYFAKRLPITYKAFSYERGEVQAGELPTAMRRDLVNFFFYQLETLQRYDVIKVYYDNGQSAVTRALHGAIEYAVSVHAIEYRKWGVAEYRLAQVADLICAIELAGLKYARDEQTRSDEMFFGTRREFTRNYLRKIRKLALT